MDSGQLQKFKEIGGKEWNNDIVDYSIICTPPKFHFSSIKKVIEFTKTKVLVEKPLVQTADELKNIFDFKDKIFVNNTRRFFPVWIALNKILKKRRDEICEIKYYEGGKLEWPMKSISYFSNGRGIIEDRGSHVFDLINMDEPIKIAK